jgi:hypothetical protein
MTLFWMTSAGCSVPAPVSPLDDWAMIDDSTPAPASPEEERVTTKVEAASEPAPRSPTLAGAIAEVPSMPVPASPAELIAGASELAFSVPVPKSTPDVLMIDAGGSAPEPVSTMPEMSTTKVDVGSEALPVSPDDVWAMVLVPSLPDAESPVEEGAIDEMPSVPIPASPPDVGASVDVSEPLAGSVAPVRVATNVAAGSEPVPESPPLV